ncbi:amidohydrolase family protein (plasmid) [Paroceanicella profunda]|uniref:Amidohydrolase family protein n=1 Tax=Paroceanicella profunda TaxID=2579971 RepID=A0A5B8G679_9RHOB|nr:amidohydrolase family protein [Paroceanicella profunda]QDL94603.1 amidohydrolase family protein [Paroceanicella profunda]
MSRRALFAEEIIAFRDGEHRRLQNGCVIVEDDRVAYVGPPVPLAEDVERHDFGPALIAPGFIDAHAHLTSAPLDRTTVEDTGKPQFWFTSLAELLPAMTRATRPEDECAMADFSVAELIRSGTTTVMEIGWQGDHVAATAERAGLRAYVAQGYGSAKWRTPDGQRMVIEWKEDDGFDGFRDACAFIDRVEGRANGRIRGYLSPMQAAMVSPALLAATKAEAEARACPVALHTSEAVFEFREMVAREGMTPIAWLEAQDFLTERCMLGHVIFTAGHSWLDHPGRDLEILAAHGASVAHCPWVFARRGMVMESFARYLDAGVTMCLGSDTAPQSLLKQMQYGAVLAKTVERDSRRPTARQMFDAATLTPARALGRDDLGRIAPGAKADLTVWRLDGFSTAPARDPLRLLVYSAEPEDLRHVMIDGTWVMWNRRLTQLDEAAVVAAARGAAQRVWRRMGEGPAALDTLSAPSLRPYT